MSSIRDLGKDPFEKYNRLMGRLNEISGFNEASRALSRFDSHSVIGNIDYLNSITTAIGIVSDRIGTHKDLHMNMLSALDTATQRLSEYHKFQPRVISAFERICDSESKLMTALYSSSTIISKFDTDLNGALSRLSMSEAFEHINSLQIVLPTMTAVAEEIDVKEEIEEEKNTGKASKRITIKEFKLYLEYIQLVVAILELLCGMIFSSIPEININITNYHSTNYYIQEINNYYFNNDVPCLSECNLNGYRFVSKQDILVRVKPDCSSYVVGKLKLGKIVQIVDKYKKWVQIRWKDSDDTYSYGWIQNYKLTEFKE